MNQYTAQLYEGSWINKINTYDIKSGVEFLLVQFVDPFTAMSSDYTGCFFGQF